MLRRLRDWLVTPTQRALKYARDNGYMAAVVERWNPHAKIRQDLFGMFDLLICTDWQTIGVQVTSRSNAAKRRQKIEESDLLAPWCAAAHRSVEVWSYGKHKVKRGGKAYRWVLKRERYVHGAWVEVPAARSDGPTT